MGRTTHIVRLNSHPFRQERIKPLIGKMDKSNENRRNP